MTKSGSLFISSCLLTGMFASVFVNC